MKINFKKIACLFLVLFLSILAIACNDGPQPEIPDDNKPNIDDKKDDDNNIDDIKIDSEIHNYKLLTSANGTYTYKCSHCDNEASFTINYTSGTDNCYTVNENTITFENITENSVYEISGEFYGNIIINVSEDYKFELELNQFSIYSYTECPIDIESADKVTISAKKGTDNYIIDYRNEAGEDDISSSLYAKCDLNVQGKGNLYVKSINNNGIHTKDDLKIKNLYLQVDCMDNALKGNDSVTIESGDLVLIARKGDGIKTKNSDISSKGKQKGTIAINGGNISIYAACDGIDAAYNAIIDESVASIDLKIYTDKYSEYSEEVTATSSDIYYIRYNSSQYKYSLKFYNSDEDYKWVNSTTYKQVGRNYYYYPMEKLTGYDYIKLYVYSSNQTQGTEECLISSGELRQNDNYDTIALQSRNGTLSYSWTNYTTQSMGGGMFGPGGMNEGNKDKGDYSTKGIKADNEIIISSGNINIKSYDDSIHTNNDNELENEETPLGNVTISGGNLILYSNDDGIHGDGKVLISGGTISVINSYEGIEGNVVEISGGSVSVMASDDGINGTGTSGESIIISGGENYIYAGGDGVDSNSMTSYDGILFSGGKTVVISTGRADSSIDTERGYKYTGGVVIAIGNSGGMSSESTKCSPSLDTIGKKQTIKLTKDNYLVVEGVATIKLPSTINALVICLGDKNANISSKSTVDGNFENTNVIWNIE